MLIIDKLIHLHHTTIVYHCVYALLNPLMGTGNYSATSNNEVGTLAVDGWDVTFGTPRRGQGGSQPAQAHPSCTNYNSPPANGQCTNFILKL